MDSGLAALLQETAQARLQALARRSGSGRQTSKRRLDISLPALAPPPMPYICTPEVHGPLMEPHHALLLELINPTFLQSGSY